MRRLPRAGRRGAEPEEALYLSDGETWGTDPVIGRRLGGTVFGGGLALYEGQVEMVGALGISGDESCTDHVVAWTRSISTTCRPA